MVRYWPDGLVFQNVILEDKGRKCPLCKRLMYVCDHRSRKVYSMDAPLQLVCKLLHCPDKECPNNKSTFSPSGERELAMPKWMITWDVFTWMGYRRFKRHWSVSQIQEELCDDYQIILSDDAIEDHLFRYQTMVAARQSDFVRLKAEYEGCPEVILSIDGLQPEKGHETLYVVRELLKERIWFAEALVSSATEEIKRLIEQAKLWEINLGVRVKAWVSDKQQAFLTTIAEVFPGRPHRYCKNHFLQDVAAEMLEIDSHAKVQLRRKVRGLRGIEKSAIEAIQPDVMQEKTIQERKRTTLSSQIITEYCSLVRGILNDNDGGPLDPPGLKMANALKSILASINRNQAVRKTGPTSKQLERLKNCIEAGLEIYQKERSRILSYLRDLRSINKTLQSEGESCKNRIKAFNKIAERLKDSKDPVKVNMSVIMTSFFEGLFAGGDDQEIPDDNLELERWFKTPKGHERRINGRKHAGTRIVYEGPTLLPTLDAHKTREKSFETKDLLPYAEAMPPSRQDEAVKRRINMKNGASKKKDQRR